MEYTIIRKKRKTLGIKVSQQGEVIVLAPYQVNIKTIENILAKRKDWIVEAKNSIKRYVSGDSFLFLGEEYVINLIETQDNNKSIEFNGSKFNVFINEESVNNLNNKIKELLYSKHKEDFLKMINYRMSSLAQIIGVKPNKVSVRYQKTIWGSCSYDDNISINFKLALAPLEVVDYILIHELCHILHKNHSKEFWMSVQTIMPNYKEKRKWLKANSCNLLF